SNRIELQAGPISGAVEPTGFREASIWPRNGSEPDQSAQRRAGLAGGEKRSCALYQVASPHQVITTEIAFALGFAPGNAQGGNHRALKDFVFMSKQHAAAQPVRVAAVARVAAEIEFWIHYGTLPLPDIRFALTIKWFSQGKKQLGHCGLVSAATGNGDGEFTAVQFDFSRECDVASLGGAELPIHLEIVHQILPAITGANVANRAPAESRAARKGDVNVFALSEDESAGADFSAASGVAGAIGRQ